MCVMLLRDATAAACQFSRGGVHLVGQYIISVTQNIFTQVSDVT